MKFPTKLDFARGEIICVDLGAVPGPDDPFWKTTEKRNNPKGDVGRPCVVVRPVRRWEHYGMTVVVPLRTTKEGKKLYDGDVLIPVRAGVKEESVAETSQVRAVDLNVRLTAWFDITITDKAVMGGIDKGLRTILGL